MKMSEINETLVEAPEAYNAKQTRGKAIKNKFKKHTPFNKAARDKATIEDETRKEAKGIKQEFKKWMASTNSAMTGEEFINFITQKHSDLAPFATDVAVNLKMYQPPAKPAADPAADPAAAAAPAPSGDIAGTEETPKATSPATADETDPLEKELEDPNTGDLPEEAGEDKEPKIDTSASIYESRFRRIQLLERDLKDNDIDTLIVRLIQAGRKGGVSVGQSPTQSPSNAGSEQEASAKKKSIWKSNIGDLAKGKRTDDDGSEQGQSSGNSSENDGMLKIDPNYKKPLKQILSTVKTSKEFDNNAKRAADKILRSLS